MIFEDLVRSLCQANRDFWVALFPSGERRLPSGLERDVDALVDDFRREIPESRPIASLRRAFDLLEQINVTLRWDAGVRDTLARVVLMAVDQVERRYGTGTGRFKRGFVLDVVIRIFGRYLRQDPFPQAVEDLLRPAVGIFVDWTVEILNIHRGREWYPRGSKKIRLPLRVRNWQAFLRFLWRVGLALRRIQVAVADLLFYPSRYERELRATVRVLAPDVSRLQSLLPPEALGETALKLVSLMEDLGRLALPHVRTVERLVRFARDHRFALGDPKVRHEILVRVTQDLLSDAYRDSDMASSLIRSDLGHFLISEMIHGTEYILLRSNLLPADEEWGPARRLAAHA